MNCKYVFVCPKCVYNAFGDKDTIKRCRYCNTEMIETNITDAEKEQFKSKMSNKDFRDSLFNVYVRNNQLYDPNEEIRTQLKIKERKQNRKKSKSYFSMKNVPAGYVIVLCCIALIIGVMVSISESNSSKRYSDTYTLNSQSRYSSNKHKEKDNHYTYVCDYCGKSEDCKPYFCQYIDGYNDDGSIKYKYETKYYSDKCYDKAKNTAEWINATPLFD